MADTETNQRLRIFVSYSREDSEFAYRLRADMEASGFDTWIDTAKLGSEGGLEWLRIIQDAIDACQVMVVVVSPDSVQSRYVHMEYHRAQTQNKRVIPLHYRTVTSAPIDLGLVQWLEFREDQRGQAAYQNGLTDLIRSLASVPQTPKLPPSDHVPATSPAPLTIAEDSDVPVFQPVRAATQLPSPNFQDLMKGMYAALGKEDLVSEEYFLRKIVESDSREGAEYVKRLNEVTTELEQRRILRLRQLAQDAVAAQQWRRALGAWQALLSTVPGDADAILGVRQARVERATQALRDGEFDEAVGTWQALLQTEPLSHDAQEGLRSALLARAEDAWDKADWTRAAESWETLYAQMPHESDAREFLDAIRQNQREAYRYRMAQSLLASDNVLGAHAALEDLYKFAPYYGDPDGIAARAGATVGTSLKKILQDRHAAEAAAEEERLKAEIAAEEERLKAEAKAEEERRVAAALEEQRLIGKKVDDFNSSVYAFLVVAVLVFINWMSTGVSAALRARVGWTGTMVQNGWHIIWMSLIIGVCLVMAFHAIAMIFRMFSRDTYWTFLYTSLALAAVITIPASWIIALWLYTGLQHGIDWASLVIIAAVGIVSMFFIGPLVLMFSV